MTACGADFLRGMIAGLNRRLSGVLEAHGESIGALLAAASKEDEALKEAEARAGLDRDARLRGLAERSEETRRRIDERHSRDLARIEKAFSNACSRARMTSSLEKSRLEDEKRKAAERGVADLKKGCAPLLVEISAGLTETAELRQEARKAAQKVAAFASELRIRLDDRPPQAADPAGRAASDRLPDEVREGLAEIERLIEACRGKRFTRLASSGPGFFSLAGLIAVAHAAALLAVRQLEPARLHEALWAAPFTFLGLLWAASIYRGWVRGKARAAVEPLHARAAEYDALLGLREASFRAREKAVKKGFLQKKSDLAAEIEEKFRSRLGQAEVIAGTRMEILKEQRDRLVEYAGRLRELRLQRDAAELEAARKAEEERHRQELERLRRAHAAAKRAIAAREKEERDGVAARWRSAIKDFHRETMEAHAACRGRHPPWGDPRWKDLRPAEGFPWGIYLGDARFDWSSLVARPESGLPFAWEEPGGAVLPLELAFPARANLFVGADSETRGPALRGIFNAVLRILCSFPPRKALFTIFDPVGLGQNFSALMHLADYDESIVGGRIWTETVHFERKLADLTEHVEKVIQKYLRNRYASIDEYNREAGQMAEPYRFLVVADFPSGFSELALERLSSIVTSGPRCGVYVLVMRDRKQKLPPPLEASALKASGLVVQATGNGFRIEEEDLEGGALAFEDPPGPESITALLHDVGRRCAEAGRVELSFETVAPGEDRIWGQSAEAGVRIPLGRSGADRLQYLEMGRGTEQHALIAGKTGSGKSTLFHVMITNAALWYSPRELELYLIDFKKGVEFKTYAVNRLPHARVIAIESDREFGLSVLRRIDRELVSRAEIFRRRGVQDFAGCRKDAAAERLPRTLLMIDEFQEFFVEEDAIAQEAALLLDRIVRQGRAFGIHVILGSQTLGGSYTLAKSTLGQMAVRIALQCNEADSYLILNDDNAAARLLSRPGEAIYNNMSGMVEGNNPFQVAWLPDDIREKFLRMLSQRADGEGARPAEPPTVFEGNVPADLRNNLPLKERLARPFREDPEGGLCAWVGEANAIKGPTEIRFRKQAGSNLLIVGPQRDSAVSVISSAVVSLAAALPPAAVRFVMLDGSPPELDHGRRFRELAGAIPHRFESVEYGRVASAMEELAAEVAGRLEGKRPPAQRILLVVHDLQRYRMLKQRGEFDLGGTGDEAPSPERCFADVLSEGPACGIHTIVWSDSLNTLNRALGRKALKDFQMKILFQMSATDSSEIIDTPAAGGLGLYRGLLYLEEHGTIEKFRPYSVPDAEILREIRGRLAAAGS